MPGMEWILLAVCVGVAVLAALWLIPRGVRAARVRRLQRIRDDFLLRREWLEARFLELAGKSGKPRGLMWVDCELGDDVAFAKDRRSGRLRALVSVTISFEAVEGGGMEDVEAVGNLRAATAVFSYDGERWETDGRAVFNLSPQQTIDRFGHELEAVTD